MRDTRGITLIALIITIIVLLILAAVSIATLTRENGILTKADTAKVETTIEEEKEQIKLAYYAVLMKQNYDGGVVKEELEQELNKLNEETIVEKNDDEIMKVTFNKSGNTYTINKVGNISGPVNKGENNPIELPKSELEIARDEGKIFQESDSRKIKDKYNNMVVIPEGFKIASDSANNVTGGVIIEDASNEKTKGSQFVWIPVGMINTNIEKTKNTTIALNRYTFGEDGKAVQQGNNIIHTYYQELKDTSHGNTASKNIEAFMASVETNGGYYIGRYEARTGEKREAKTNNEQLGQITVKGNEYVYNYVTQPQAAKLSQEMYVGKNFTSDLINSYAWDTAIMFIQTFGKNNYARQTSVNTGLAPTGTNNLPDAQNQDSQCNIWDMASNSYEWTTETSMHNTFPCVTRAGDYDGSNNYTTGRYYNYTTSAYDLYSFRLVIYM